MAVNAVSTNGSFVYNVNNSATQVLAAKQVKENIFAKILHKNGKGVTEEYATNASSVRIFKVIPTGNRARQLGATVNGGYFNSKDAKQATVKEYDLNLLYIMDLPVDLPEVQQDMVSVNIFDETTKNLGGENALEINASTIAHQLKPIWDAAYAAQSWTGLAIELASTPDYLSALLDASAILDDGDPDNHIQSFPFENRQALISAKMRRGLMAKGQVLIGGSNYAQSMLAKGGLSPEDSKDFGDFYLGEIDLIPIFLMPKAVRDEATVWGGGSNVFDGVEAIVCSALATDRGISTLDYIKVVDSQAGAGKRLQPKTRWGINVCYPKGIIPIVAHGTSATEVTITAPDSVSVG